MNITTVKEGKRGCGYRQPGGLYLRSSGLGQHCGRLPISLTVCPCCHAGIKPSRGWTWVDGDSLIGGHPCSDVSPDVSQMECQGTCPLGQFHSVGKVGLLWIGEKFYTPREWLAETRKMGASRRISAVPKRFVLGETWVFAAHRKAIQPPPVFGQPVPKAIPGIFHVFQPDKIEYVVKDTDKKEKLEGMEKRGITLIKVERLEEE